MLTLTSFVVMTIQVYFSGNISSTNQDIKSQIIGLHFFVKADKKIMAKTVIDTARKYSLNFMPSEETSFDFFITGFGIDTILLKSYRTFPSDIITWNIELPIKHKKVLGKAVCPKCDKTDLTYPIVYTDPPLVQQTIKNGDTIISCIVNNKYYADTDVHGLLSPNWYCKRDKVKY
jgi:hypothetical protein